jgi:single stranded DNA-binding protein
MIKINNVIISGNLTKEVEISEINGKYLHKFTVAVDDSYKKDGEWINRAVFMNVEYWGNSELYLSKGENVVIIGKLKQDSWESETGKHSIILVRAYKVQKTQKQPATVEQTPRDDDDGVPF